MRGMHDALRASRHRPDVCTRGAVLAFGGNSSAARDGTRANCPRDVQSLIGPAHLRTSFALAPRTL